MNQLKKKNILTFLRNKYFVRTLMCLLVAGVAAFIFSNSLVPGEASGQQSESITGWLSGRDEIPENDPLETLVRKAGHVLEYALLGLCLVLALRTFTPRLWPHALIPGAVGLGVGAADELLQYFIPGRAARLSDIIIDFSGVILGMLLGRLLMRVARAIRAKLAQKHGKSA